MLIYGIVYVNHSHTHTQEQREWGDARPGRRRLTIVPPAWSNEASGSRFSCLGALDVALSGVEDLGADGVFVQVALDAMDEEEPP
jgi:hypothetical protein